MSNELSRAYAILSGISYALGRHDLDTDDTGFDAAWDRCAELGGDGDLMCDLVQRGRARGAEARGC